MSKKRKHPHWSADHANALGVKALETGDVEHLFRAADAHHRASELHRASGLIKEADHHAERARMFGYAAKNPDLVAQMNSAGQAKTAAATAAAAAHFNPNSHPHNADGKWAPTGKGTHSHEARYRGR